MMLEFFDDGSICRMLHVNHVLQVIQHKSYKEGEKGPPSAHTASHMAQANWRAAEGVGSHDHDRPGVPIWTVSRRLRMTDNGLDESV